ncbi:glutamine amidotransferase-related protein [Zooshikella ganghwensis]|uniref:GMP synthase n=1 Tax=Zooshikella ganghwensis TaxID=202772 RepID=A0A4P9VR85_9GAMM|nr:gamma-glutamyl-gamma-aminobutyrate hydrolase family protein [Zooshikella ganghwensis]RDH46098.1 GMP synthase [Zooshikella ganghwensis]
MKLGILQCDDVRPELLRKHGNYPAMIQKLLSAADFPCEFSIFQVHHNEFPDHITVCDAYITTGSRYSAYDNLTWIRLLETFFLQIAETNIPVVGICFGHQVMAQALGGQVAKSPNGWGVGVYQNDIVLKTPWMDPVQSNLNLVASHQDQVINLPSDATHIAGCAFCPNYMALFTKNMLGIQGHPEFSKAYGRDLLECRIDVVPAAVMEQALASFNSEDDSIVCARWILNFFDEFKRKIYNSVQ